MSDLPKPRTRRSVASRARLLDAAAELFLERGYTAVSMQEIAERAGLTKAGMYGHVPSKARLLVEAIRWKLETREAAPAFSDALQTRESAFETLWSDDGRDVRLLMTDAASVARHEPEVAAGLAALDAERRAAVAERLVGRSVDPEMLAWFMITFSAGIGVKESIGVRPPGWDRLGPLLERLAEAFA